MAVGVLVLPGQEKRLTELARVHARDGDGAGHHQEHAAFIYGPRQDGQRVRRNYQKNVSARTAELRILYSNPPAS